MSAALAIETYARVAGAIDQQMGFGGMCHVGD